MNLTENHTASLKEMDSSCRVPLLALFGGAALWLVLGIGLGLVAGLSFHKPDIFADVAPLSFGRAQAAANDLVLYGFVIPSAIGVMLWILCRLSRSNLALPLVAVAAANLWHLGVLIGTVFILMGEGTGHLWLEYPRAASVPIFAAFILLAVCAVATMGLRSTREMYPSHWFFLAALLWFSWSYSTANLFLGSGHPPRGVVQALVAWWHANNLLFVWMALAGVGIAFYLLPKIAARPLAGSGYTLFAFLTLVFFGSWCGVPLSAPVPAWLTTISAFAALLSVIPVVAIGIIAFKTVRGAKVPCAGGPYCFIRFGLASFVLSGLLYITAFCPRCSDVLEFTWFNFGVTQWQLLGFGGALLTGAMLEILPRIMGGGLPLPRLAKLGFFLFVPGVLVFVLPLLVGGFEQGMKLQDPAVPFAEAAGAALKLLRVSALGQLLMLSGALCLFANILVMSIRWKIGLAKAMLAFLKSPLVSKEVAS